MHERQFIFLCYGADKKMAEMHLLSQCTLLFHLIQFSQEWIIATLI